MKEKIILVYHDVNGNIAEEIIWAIPEGKYFKIDNIPFFAPNLALNDIIKTEVEDGLRYFDDLITPSGNSTIQIVFFKIDEIPRVIQKIEDLGCKWESMENKPYFAVDIPAIFDYSSIKFLLDHEMDTLVLDYKEACLSENHG